MGSGGLTNFVIEWLPNEETFVIKNALSVMHFIDDEDVLPDAVNAFKLLTKESKFQLFLNGKESTF